MNSWQAAFRLARVALHLLVGFAVAPALGRAPAEACRAFVGWWARGLLRALGVRLESTGGPIAAPALIVGNHVSWLDVIALLAAQPALFVCKSEVASWPGIGWLLKRADTIFIRRGSFRDVWRVNQQLRARFAAGQSVAAFPEGTTTLGEQVLPFRPALFQPAVECGLAIRPVAIGYSSVAAAYANEITFVQSLLAICRSRDLEARVTVLPPIPRGLTRREAAERTRSAILEALSNALPQRQTAAPVEDLLSVEEPALRT